MAYCAPLGIPYSVFMGRVVLPGEAEWTEEDTLLATEWKYLEGFVCGGCGQDLRHSLEDAGAYDTETIRCYGCEAKERATTRVADKGDAAGVRVLVRYIPEIE